ncbi:DUF72 domain-containing protein, partial [Paenibacillus polymyxa]|nr:DUF72 domain-containing protein [Paenibacillus polymyxa]
RSRYSSQAKLDLARRHRAATVYTDSEEFPAIADRTGDFVYARLMRASTRYKAGYAPKALDAWAELLLAWSRGAHPDDLPRIGAPPKPAKSAK